MNNSLQREFKFGWLSERIGWTGLGYNCYIIKIHLPIKIKGRDGLAYCGYDGVIFNHAHSISEFYKDLTINRNNKFVIELCKECEKQENLKDLIK